MVAGIVSLLDFSGSGKAERRCRASKERHVPGTRDRGAVAGMPGQVPGLVWDRYWV
jgi:hypothetical protein